MAALTVAQGVTSYLGDVKYAKDASRALSDSADAQQAALLEARAQGDQQATQAAFERGREGLIERGRIAAAIGESGTYAGSIERLLDESDANQAHDIATIEANRVARNRQNDRERVGTDAGARSQINSIRKPNLLGSALQIGGGLAATSAAARTAPRSSGTGSVPTTSGSSGAEAVGDAARGGHPLPPWLH